MNTKMMKLGNLLVLVILLAQNTVSGEELVTFKVEENSPIGTLVGKFIVWFYEGAFLRFIKE